MGKFKRSKSGKRRRWHLSLGELPEHWNNPVSCFKAVLAELKKEKEIKKYTVIGFRHNKSIFLFKIKLPFWQRSVVFNIFLYEKNSTECAIRQSQPLSFDVVLGRQTPQESIEQHVKEWLAIIKSGLDVEEVTIEKLNNFFKQSGLPFSVKKSQEEIDIEEKIDMVVEGYDFPVGIQLKTNPKDWVEHKKKYPKVPSILLNAKTPAKKIAQAIKKITVAISQSRVAEHVNLLNVLKAPS